MSGSITHWLLQLRSGDRNAAQPIWEKYFYRLVRVARTHLNGSPRRVADEEDVVICAFDSFCRGAEQGRFPKLDDRTDLWRVLVTITERKAINQVKHDTRKKRTPAGRTMTYSDAEYFQEVSPSPKFCAGGRTLFGVDQRPAGRRIAFDRRLEDGGVLERRDRVTDGLLSPFRRAQVGSDTTALDRLERIVTARRRRARLEIAAHIADR